jgi:hypothetical protein
MTQTLTVNVEYEELMTRADEVEAPILGVPTENPAAPCALAMITTAAAQLEMSADNLRTYLFAGERERRRLAESLRNAAKAYEQVDEVAAQAVKTGDGSVSPVMPDLTDSDLDAVTLTDTPVVTSSNDGDFTEVKQAAWEIEQTDNGAAFLTFADAWTALQRTLLEARDRFRPFVYWDGDACAAVEQNFDEHRSWLYDMADSCGKVASQARGVTSAHRSNAPQHPPYYKIVGYEEFYSDPSLTPADKANVMTTYASFQQESEEVLGEYAKQAALPLPPLQPPWPPTALRIAEPVPPTAAPELPENPGQLPWDESPTGIPSGPSAGMPTMPATPDDSTPTDELTDASGAWAPSGSTASGVKPASFGGGVGAPPMPLQPPAIAEGGSQPAGAGRPAGLTGMPLGARGGMGAGGTGMPMGGGQGANGQNNGKGKRIQQGDEALYKEDRQWTAPVIGNRRRNDLPGSEDAA